MRLTTIVNLPVVFLALVIGAAAVPRDVNHNAPIYPKVKDDPDGQPPPPVL
ncbi:hypothetical protein BGY98DRAFT_1099358 [Russula aff. rugulosa BPL654]|nr:hypothetical protein BGY98DRAFT_1099358 [Russula aff. rugulosa BPL654]